MALQDRQPLDVWATVLLLVVPLIALLARIYVRVTKKTFGLDDSLIVVGAFFYVLQCTTVIGGAVHGLGLQTDHITSDAIYIQAGQVSSNNCIIVIIVILHYYLPLPCIL